MIKNKAFFFVDYEGTQQRDSGSVDRQRRAGCLAHGRSSDLLTKTVGNIVIKDPLDRHGLPRQHHPGVAIVNPVAQKLFSSPDLYPLPNNTGTGALGITSNYVSTSANTLKNNQADAKGDFRPNDKDSISRAGRSAAMSSSAARAALPVFLTAAQYRAHA